MSEQLIRAALEQRLDTITPSLATAYENVHFDKPTDLVTPWQAVHVLFGEPVNLDQGGDGFQLNGFMRVNLMYELRKGSAAALARALLIRAAFARKTVLTNSGATVTIHRTPAIGNGFPADERWNLPVTVPFFSNLQF